ncbi:ATP-dependent DNA helicase [Trichonephila clavata]|uniref:ATP-dependent DNA helicase n=1 Tax=Trichonephila clavata TaxID=2740835 RepID=A0A8X6GHL3_TRICU|nr:ATP-dependent DNA helicase [Trichonephila clavata]
MCCSSGKVKLPPILKPPEPLCSLLKGETAQSKDFVKHIRLFSNMFVMTSFKSNDVLNNGWTPTFKVQGQVYHHAGPLHPAIAEDSKYLQIYFLGEDEAILASRNDVVEKLNVPIQKQLPGKEYAYKSIDCILNDDEAIQYPIEFLNSIQTPDLQAYNLILKEGGDSRASDAKPNSGDRLANIPSVAGATAQSNAISNRRQMDKDDADSALFAL